ncbi:MAG TPA: hypothetical protein VM370_12345 [Candidatus Thermoplasmatota archaeon]|nr:hypothetical protein [Candidatus Thermoplasmatota archaeon]
MADAEAFDTSVRMGLVAHPVNVLNGALCAPLTAPGGSGQYDTKVN